MTGARYRPRQRALIELAGTPGMRRALTGVAHELRREISAATPVGDGPRGGRAAASIRVRSDTTGVRVESTDAFFHLIEWGSVNNPAYAPFRRGIRAAGLRLDESRL